MNIIIVGAGKVGMKLAEKLSQEKEHDITLIDLKYTNIQHAINQYDIMAVTGDAVSQETLAEAGIEKADLLIAVTGNDELNLIICLIAKKCGNLKTIARIRRPEYNKDIHLVKEDLGLAMIITPEQAAASDMARVLRFPTATQIDTFSKGRVELMKIRIPEDSPLDNLKISDLTPKLNCDVLVCGVERGEEAFIPGGNFVLKSGDYISIVSSVASGAYFFKKIGIKTSSVKDTIIVGGGTTAYYLANRLIQTGISVKIIEQDEKRCDELFQLLPKATIINGDGTDKNTLLEAGIEYAESFVSLTNIDEENVLLSLYAKSKGVKKVVTKVNKIEYDNVLNSLDLDSVFYPKDITAEYILRFVRARNQSRSSNIETVHLILDGKAEALEFRIKRDSPISDIPISKLNLKPNVLIASIARGGQIIIPRGSDIIKAGDSVVIVTNETGFTDISDILE